MLDGAEDLGGVEAGGRKVERAELLVRRIEG
jgi:hypothetical protein